MKKFCRSLAITILSFTPVLAIAQTALQRALLNDTMPNLVPNPGFEVSERLYCSWTQDVAKFNKNLEAWNSPTQTTPDHFSTQNDPKCWAHPSKHSNGSQSPRSGSCMAGIKIYGKGNTPTYWHEYLQAELMEPLEAGRKYIAECWVLRAARSNEASNNIGILITDVPVSTRDRLPLYITPTVNEEKVVKGGWHKVSGVFEADGSEKYILIGNFYGDDATRHEKLPEGERGGYYYIDDVNVRLAPPDAKLSPRPNESVPPPPREVPVQHASSNDVDIHQVEPNVGTRVRLDNVQFEFDRSELVPGSEKELIKLVDLMTDYPFLRVEIEGHTDDEGTEAYNEKLSTARAEAVVNFLVKKDIEKERLTWKGYGESRPLVPNDSEANRAINRRVEFHVLER